MATPENDSLKKAYKTAGIIGFAFMASEFACAFLVELLHRGHLIKPLLSAEVVLYFRIAFIILAILAIFLANFFREGIKSRKIIIKPKPSAQPLYPENVARLFYSTIISFAFYVSVALLGLILFLLTGLYKDFYAFLIGSMLMFFIHFPSFEQWQKGSGLEL